MNFSIKLLSLALVGTAVVDLQSCKKYEEGPGFSLRSKTARLVGEWELVDGDNYDRDDELLYEFEKDGDFTAEYEYDSYYGDVTGKVRGDWQWLAGKETIEIELDSHTIEYTIIKLKNTELILEDEDGDQWEFESK